MSILESRFTPPRDDCPHPEWWTSLDDESTEVEVSELVAGFVRALQPELVVESGAAFGQTSSMIGRALSANGHGRLASYETDEERRELAAERCAGLPVQIILGEFGAPFPDGIGFAWIDGHITRRVHDLYAVRTALARGAVVGVHDSGPQHGIRDEVEGVRWVRWINLPTPRGVLFGEVL
jgi:predicted O-methyltransferase YrrM